MQPQKCSSMLPIGLWFFNHVMVGGGIPVASHVNVTGLLTVSTVTSLSGPSIVGGTGKRQKQIAHHHLVHSRHGLSFAYLGERELY